MGFLDTLKTKLAPARGKVSDLAQQHGDRIDHGIEKAARMVDQRTRGKYSDKIESGTVRARHAVDRLAHRDDGGGAPPAPPAPPPV
ncbi:antitoxin [Streptomyces sp. TRM76323]|uniref:Antitoxin n=1 Tax=Streptomyces tamarix TaxID=3078565 RepID=A0ABU3QSM2_9ACTN|nr:antitoxin [Streptomyces tamarix]MDT9685752.1 antitoxin [Streptomyces tamarix]